MKRRSGGTRQTSRSSVRRHAAVEPMPHLKLADARTGSACASSSRTTTATRGDWSIIGFQSSGLILVLIIINLVTEITTRLLIIPLLLIVILDMLLII